MAGHFTEIPHQTEFLQQPDEAIARVDLPPEKAVVGGVRIMVVVVVPAVAEREEGQHEAIAAVISSRIASRADHVAQGIDQEGVVQDDDRAEAKTDAKQAPAADQPEHPSHEHSRHQPQPFQPD